MELPVSARLCAARVLHTAALGNRIAVSAALLEGKLLQPILQSIDLDLGQEPAGAMGFSLCVVSTCRTPCVFQRSIALETIHIVGYDPILPERSVLLVRKSPPA